MATLTLRPTGAGFVTQWTPSAGNNWQNVDESSADDDTTYNSHAGGGGAGDFFTTAGGVPVGATVNSVTFSHRAKHTGSLGFLSGLVRIGSTNYTTIGPGLITASYADYSSTAQTTSPATGIAWTVSEVNAMQLGYGDGSSSPAIRVTQVWAVVDYTSVTPVNVQPAAVSATFAVAAPAFGFSALTVVPDVTHASFVVPAPAFVQTGLASTLTAGAVYATFVVAQPTFIFGSFALAPQPVHASFVVPSAEISVPVQPASQGPGAWGMASTRRRRRYGDS